MDCVEESIHNLQLAIHNSQFYNRPMTKIRIKGIVRTMNRVREKLAVGVEGAEADQLRHQVKTAVADIDAICRQHRVKPEQLPAPSYRAYQFLRTLHLDNLPKPVPGAADLPPKRVRILNLVAISKDMQLELAEIASQNNPQQQSLLVEALRTRLLTNLQEADKIIEDQNGRPTDLPTQSRNAYQWLRYLSDPAALAQHLETLATLQTLVQTAVCRASVPVSQRDLPVTITLAVAAHLYRSKTHREWREWSVHQGFAGAPANVLEALVCAMLTGEKEPYLATIREYAQGEEFAEVMAALLTSDESGEVVTRGRHYDLDEVFKRVNKVYFNGRMPRPRLTWNRTLTRSKMGHYQPGRDTVMISITLDNAAVPAYVIDFVMYHELLHKKLGIQMVNGRRLAHTPTFRQEERRFKQYDAARQFLSGFERP
jgi:hypothetical protein